MKSKELTTIVVCTVLLLSMYAGIYYLVMDLA